MEVTFGEKLRTLRREAGMSQRELAKRIGVDFSYISKIENNRLAPPAANTIVKISEVLGIESEVLLAITGKLPTDIQDNVATNPKAQSFLRQAEEMNLTDTEWELLTASLKQLRDDDQ